MLRAVAVVTGWVIVDVSDEALIEEALAAAGHAKRDVDEVWTDFQTGADPNDQIGTEQVLIILRDPPNLDEVEDGSVPEGQEVDEEPGGLPETADTVVAGEGA